MASALPPLRHNQAKSWLDEIAVLRRLTGAYPLIEATQSCQHLKMIRPVRLT